ncbi:MAG TPA: NPCBM/NEW2 domain-containing protein [Pirellulales bacterium]|nr:NPCBM/NEW2 domain-containing protein [Pirellulales bacterium]
MILSAYVLATVLTASADFQLQTTDGQTYYGNLVAFGADGVEFETPQEKVKIPLARLSDVSRVNRPQPPGTKPAVWLELIDGSQLLGARYTVQERVAKIELGGEQVVELPTAAIAYVRFQQFEGELASQWANITVDEPTGDLIVIHKKGALDYQAGVLGDITDTTVAFKLDDEDLSVKRARVAGLVYYHAVGKELPASICQLVDLAGSRFEVARAKLVDDKLEVTSPAGLKRSVALDQIAALTARVQYLSDLQPESATWTGYVSGPNLPDSVKRSFLPRFNEAVDGGELRIGATVYAKGVAMCSRSELVYRLPPGQFKRLIAVAGIDSRGRPAGAVRLLIYGDGKPLVESDVTGNQEPLAINVDLTGVSRLKIVADFGPGGDVMDLFDLCDARILQ